MRPRLCRSLPAVLLLSLTTNTSALKSADSLAATNSFWTRHTIAQVAAPALAGGTLLYSWAVWWKNDYRSFRFYNEPLGFFDAHLGIDKVGHMYTSYSLFHSVNEVLRWGNHDDKTSFWWATTVSAFHAFAVEIGDGFSEYGFDYEDLLANWSGVAYCVLQHEVPILQNFEMKWSLFYPLQRHSFKINDLYDYHIYWLSARVNELLPATIEPLWPDWLQAAFGYSSEDQVTRREFVFSLDYNLEKIPIGGRDADLAKRLLNLFHLPAPGVKLSPGHSPEFQLLLLN